MLCCTTLIYANVLRITAAVVAKTGYRTLQAGHLCVCMKPCRAGLIRIGQVRCDSELRLRGECLR